MRRFGLGAKLIILIAVFLVIIFALVTFVLVKLNTSTLRSNLVNNSKAFAALATEPIGKTFLTYQDSGTLRISEAVHRFTDLDSNISNVAVVDNTGKNLFSLQDKIPSNISSLEATSFKPTYSYDKAHNLSQVIQPFIEDFGAHRYSLVYTISSSEVQRNINQVITTILFFVFVSLILSISLTYLAISYMFVNPLKRVTRQALAISAGDLDQQIKLDRNDEISDLANSLNSMANSLKEDIAKLQETDRLKTEFMIITSHSLRTPLTIINGYLDQIEDINSVDDLKNVLRIIGNSAKQLGVFAEDVLTISDIEAGKHLLKFEPADVKSFAQRIADEFDASAKQKGTEFKTEFDTQGQMINISTAHLRSAIWNLLDNALKFTSKDGQIEFSVGIVGKDAVFTVKDNGIGIAHEEMPKLFTKFHRGTDIMHYDYAGAGIGLYITKLVVKEHGGDIKAESTLGKGSKFTITIPLAEE